MLGSNIPCCQPTSQKALPAIVQAAGPAASAQLGLTFSEQSTQIRTRSGPTKSPFANLSDGSKTVGRASQEFELVMLGSTSRPYPGCIGTKKVHRAAIKKLFDLLVERHTCLINPWANARTEKHIVKSCKTPRIELKEVQK